MTLLDHNINGNTVAPNNLKEEEFQVTVWSENCFSTAEADWTDLLYRSGVNPLFLSWAWMNGWWDIFRPSNGELRVIAVRIGGKLVGIAPLYCERSKMINGLIPVVRIQLLGKRLEGSSGLRAEYMDFLVDPEYREAVLGTICKTLIGWSDWTELSLQDMDTTSPNYGLINKQILNAKCHHRIEGAGVSYEVKCNGYFPDYLAGLGSNTRLKLYNRRKLLEQQGEVALTKLNELNKSVAFDQLNSWHTERWGCEAFNSAIRQFIIKVLDEGDRFLSDFSSVLSVNGRPVSVIINVACRGRVYNIQLGYVNEYNKKISLGTLHIGYHIESAFSIQDISIFDFLEGEGKNSNYKKNLGHEGRRIESARWIRAFIPRLLYSTYDRYFRR
ncbi:GNAT family N-acetyltransferase [Saccharospirillum sp.]|uniref:GNAT family N-acetyltransferase n=1 Tax=Saccharospirillum sp. TaxID=2033801 RepID=UPI0034A08899